MFALILLLQDVVIICFSVIGPASLENVVAKVSALNIPMRCVNCVCVLHVDTMSSCLTEFWRVVAHHMAGGERTARTSEAYRSTHLTV